MTSAPSLWFEPRTTRVGLTLTFAIGVLAMVAVLLSGVPAGWRLGLAILVGIAMVHSVHAIARNPPVQCRLRPDGDWTIRQGTIEVPARLERSHDLGFLIALHFRADASRRIDVVLWPDSIPTDTRRQLRVWLGRKSGRR